MAGRFGGGPRPPAADAAPEEEGRRDDGQTDAHVEHVPGRSALPVAQDARHRGRVRAPGMPPPEPSGLLSFAVQPAQQRVVGGQAGQQRPRLLDRASGRGASRRGARRFREGPDRGRGRPAPRSHVCANGGRKKMGGASSLLRRQDGHRFFRSHHGNTLVDDAWTSASSAWNPGPTTSRSSQRHASAKGARGTCTPAALPGCSTFRTTACVASATARTS